MEVLEWVRCTVARSLSTVEAFQPSLKAPRRFTDFDTWEETDRRVSGESCKLPHLTQFGLTLLTTQQRARCAREQGVKSRYQQGRLAIPNVKHSEISHPEKHRELNFKHLQAVWTTRHRKTSQNHWIRHIPNTFLSFSWLIFIILSSFCHVHIARPNSRLRPQHHWCNGPEPGHVDPHWADTDDFWRNHETMKLRRGLWQWWLRWRADLRPPNRFHHKQREKAVIFWSTCHISYDMHLWGFPIEHEAGLDFRINCTAVIKLCFGICVYPIHDLLDHLQHLVPKQQNCGQRSCSTQQPGHPIIVSHTRPPAFYKRFDF